MEIEIKTIKLSQVKINKENPRRIGNAEMDRLVKSLQDFPDMLQLREIVVDETMTVLGGNMRLLALRKIGAKECTAKIVRGLTPEQKREFIIKDNGSWGEWDFDLLANGWDDLPLVDWGVDLPEDWLKEAKEEENNMAKITDCKKIEDVSIHYPKINKVRSCRFISVRRFKNNKDQAIDIFKSIKKERDFDVENFIASEVSELLTSFGIFKDMIVTPAPRGHSLENDYYLSGVVADKIADKLGIISCQLFKDNIKKTNNVHKYEEKNACLLGDIKSKNIIIFDDIATTGTTMENCCKALCKHNFIIPIVYIYETLKTGE